MADDFRRVAEAAVNLGIFHPATLQNFADCGKLTIPRLHLTLGLPLKLVRDSVLPDALQAAGGHHFRYCRKCLCRGYHSVVHQIGANKCCPVHGDMLEIACRTCGAKAPYRLNVALLDAPYRCGGCGHLYGASPPASLPHKRPFNKKARIAVTRLRRSYFAYF